jgi:hypothetical protein
LPEDPVKVLGLLHHLSTKTWATPDFLRLVMERVAEAHGWDLGKFSS